MYPESLVLGNRSEAASTSPSAHVAWIVARAGRTTSAALLSTAAATASLLRSTSLLTAAARKISGSPDHGHGIPARVHPHLPLL